MDAKNPNIMGEKRHKNEGCVHDEKLRGEMKRKAGKGKWEHIW